MGLGFGCNPFMEEYHGTQEVPVQGNSVRPRDTVSTVM